MAIIYILIAFSVVIAITFLSAFIWASKTGQFDDSYTPSVRMLFDDGTITTTDNPQSKKREHGNRKV